MEDLEQIKKDYSELKEKFQKVEMDKEKLLRQSIRKDINFINQKKWISFFAGIIAIVGVSLLTWQFGLRLPFLIVSVVWMLVEMVAKECDRDLDIDSISGESTQTFIKEIKKRKEKQFRWFRIHVPLFVIWVGYFFGECLHAGMPKREMIPLLAGITIGAIIGLIVAFRIHNRLIGTYENILFDMENPEV